MTRLAITLSATALTATAALAQAPAAPIAAPASGLIINYRYWPTQYVQFVGTELPYSMIALETDGPGKQPIYNITLSERASGKRIHYTNDDGVVAASKAQGEEAHKVAIAVEGGETQTNGDTMTARFTMADGKPLQWRFVQGSDVSEQGAGLTPLPTAPVPVFAYREQGAVAGEGTALQIGNTVSAADVWKEISQPPYFIAYHGALSQSAHTIAFAPGKEAWTMTAGPAALTAGSKWELDSENGDHRTLTIVKVNGSHFLVTGVDRYAPSAHFTIDATRNADAWTVTSVRYAPNRDGDKHGATLLYTPAGTVTLVVGKKTTLATGSLTSTGTPSNSTIKLDFTTPAWVKGKTMMEETILAPSAVTIVAHPAS